jgi:serine/threonine protein kinase
MKNKKFINKFVSNITKQEKKKSDKVLKDVAKSNPAKNIVKNEPKNVAATKIGKKDIIFNDTHCKFIDGGIDGNVYTYGKFALKKYDNYYKKDFQNEVNLLKMLSHPNIIAYKDDFADDEFLYIVLELGRESVGRYLNNIDDLIKVKVAKKIMRDVLNGLIYLHDKGIIHRDIKIENYVFCANTIKLIDFAAATHIDDVYPKITGTLILNSPEMSLGMMITPANDIWSFALSAFEIITNQLIFDVNDDYEYEYCDELSFVECDYSDSGDDLTYANIYRLLLLQEKMMGSPPESMTEWAPQYYNSDGRLKNTKNITYFSFRDFIKVNFPAKFNNHLTASFLDFIECCLTWEAEKRPTARQLLCHKYLL